MISKLKNRIKQRDRKISGPKVIVDNKGVKLIAQIKKSKLEKEKK